VAAGCRKKLIYLYSDSLGRNLADVEVGVFAGGQLEARGFFSRCVEAESVAAVGRGHCPVCPQIGRQVDGVFLVGRAPVVDVQGVAGIALVGAGRPENASDPFHTWKFNWVRSSWCPKCVQGSPE